MDGLAIGGQYLYWSNYGSSTIGRANLDGSDANQQFIGVASPVQLAVSGDYIYWASLNGDIGRANLSGADVDSTFITGVGEPYGVAVNGEHIYWGNYAAGTIGRANLDGTGVDATFITGALYPVDLALDSHYLYWANIGNGTIGRANLDGSGVDQSFITGASDAYGLAVDAGAPPAPPVPAMTFGSETTSGADASLSATCSGSAGPVCTGTVTLTATERARGKRVIGVAARRRRKRRTPVTTPTVTVASVPYSIAAGASETLRIPLNATGRRLLTSFYKLPTELTVSGTGSLTQALTFAYTRFRLSLAYSWLFNPAFTTARQLTLGGVPAGDRLEVLCHGGGCPFAHHLIRRPRRQVKLAPLFAGRHLRPRSTIELIVTGSDQVGDVLFLTVRSDNTPAEKIRCLPPGFRRPAACA